MTLLFILCWYTAFSDLELEPKFKNGVIIIEDGEFCKGDYFCDCPVCEGRVIIEIFNEEDWEEESDIRDLD